jgi:hypothetical protein
MSALWTKRRIALATALLLTLVAAVWASRMEHAPAPTRVARDAPAADETGTSGTTAGAISMPAVVAESASTAAAPELAVARVALLRRSHETPPRANVFAAKSFYVPPPKPKRVAMVAPSPPPPVAPPLPFTYMGMLKEGASTVVFIVGGERLHSVRVGDVIDGTWRVETVGSEEVTFVYLPMNEKQTLRIGGSS